MRHANVRNVDEVEVREMIKGRHNMRLRQLGRFIVGTRPRITPLGRVGQGRCVVPGLRSTRRRSVLSPAPTAPGFRRGERDR